MILWRRFRLGLVELNLRHLHGGRRVRLGYGNAFRLRVRQLHYRGDDGAAFRLCWSLRGRQLSLLSLLGLLSPLNLLSRFSL